MTETCSLLLLKWYMTDKTWSADLLTTETERLIFLLGRADRDGAVLVW